MKSRYKEAPPTMGQLIGDLYKSYEAWRVGGVDVDLRDVKWKFQHAAVHVYENCGRKDATPELFRIAAQVLPEYAETMALGGERIRMKASKGLLIALQDSKALEACLAAPKGERAVAWACLQRALECDLSKITDKENLVHNVVLQWLGRGLPAPTNPRLSDLVGTIYGGHYWTADFMDIKFDDKTLPNSLWKQNPPIIKNVDLVARQKTDATELPSDFTL